jgi:hypothetical protein
MWRRRRRLDWMGKVGGEKGGGCAGMRGREDGKAGMGDVVG